MTALLDTGAIPRPITVGPEMAALGLFFPEKREFFIEGRGLFRAGMRVGRDLVGSIVNTLALAFVGASLPLLIVFRLSDLSFERVVGSEIVATEIVRALVGSVGLVASTGKFVATLRVNVSSAST